MHDVKKATKTREGEAAVLRADDRIRGLAAMFVGLGRVNVEEDEVARWFIEEKLGTKDWERRGSGTSELTETTHCCPSKRPHGEGHQRANGTVKARQETEKKPTMKRPGLPHRRVIEAGEGAHGLLEGLVFRRRHPGGQEQSAIAPTNAGQNGGETSGRETFPEVAK